MKLIMENWNKYLNELDLNEINSVESGSTAESTPEDISQTYDTTHIDTAMAEMDKFNNGRLKEQHRKAWKIIAKYWKHAKKPYYAAAVLRGAYARPNSYMSKQGAWSSAFIQYCMKNNKEFQKLRHCKHLGRHKCYWKAARKNTKKLKEGQDIPENDWIFLSMSEAEKIDYTPQPGDLTFIVYGSGLHGDIVTPRGSVGGNLKNTIKVNTGKKVALMTQDKKVKIKLSESQA